MSITKPWASRFGVLAQLVSTWSKDPLKKVGAVIVDGRRRIVSVGYNGFPRDVDDDPARYEEKSVKYAMIVHAEANAILNANAPVRGLWLFTTKYPCTECVKLIIQSGVDVIYSPMPSTSGKWADDSVIAKQMLAEACVQHVELVLQ